jgi:deoxycytidylate deaminase
MTKTFKYKAAQTPMIIFGVSGLIGSGASFVANSLEKELKSYGYKVSILKVAQSFLESKFSDIPAEDDKKLIEQILKRDLGSNSDNQSATSQHTETSKANTIIKLQDQGNKLRKIHGNAVFSEMSAYCLAGKIIQAPEERHAYIIDSLKNPEEVSLLRSLFREAFFMVGVVADDNIRKSRLFYQKQIKDKEFDEISKNEGAKNGHLIQIRKTVLGSDYFFENNYDKSDKIDGECRRLLNLIFQDSIITPRQDEHGMHLAFVEARKSACMSRQVGAAIVSKEGDVLSLGHNDVPEFGGGLYDSESTNDRRCFANSRVCHNDLEKGVILDSIIAKIKECTCIDDDVIEKIKSKIKETGLGDLTEFSRAVHAEMDAIIGVARSVTPGIVGSTMYVTTYPCHNCAKHIIDAGIKRVVFLEPYEKSMALKLHFDAIHNPFTDCEEHKVRFDNYGGIAPHRYNELLAINPNRERKDKNKKLAIHPIEEILPITNCSAESMKSILCRFREFFKEKFDLCGA